MHTRSPATRLLVADDLAVRDGHRDPRARPQPVQDGSSPFASSLLARDEPRRIDPIVAVRPEAFAYGKPAS